MTSASDQRDAAWVVLETPLAPSELAAFCRRLEMLYRINPFLEFESWQQNAPDVFRASAHNHSNGLPVVLEGRLAVESDDAWRIDFASGPKRHTRFEVAPAGRGSRLTITDEYRRPEEGETVSPELVDRSLHAWGVALKIFLERDRRWRWVPLYRWAMRRVWLPMKPAGRRVLFLVLVIAVADAALIALGFAIYWLESGRAAP